MEVVANNYLPGDQRLVDKIVYELKAQGIFDQFRKECFADVDTKPAYQNLRQRVEGSVAGFLKDQSWRPDMNKNQVREMLRKKITESGYLETGVERIVDQVVNPKINTVFLPKVEEVVYNYLGIKKPKNEPCDLLPQDLEAVSPESEPVDKKDEKSTDTFQDLDESKTEEDESPPFEPLEEQSVYVPHEENSVDSHLSGFSGLVSHESNQSEKAPVVQEQDSQMSRNSSDSRLSIVTSDENSKMEVAEEHKAKISKPEAKPKSSDSHKSRSDKERKDSRSRHSSTSKDKDKDKDKSRDRKTSSSSKTDKTKTSSKHGSHSSSSSSSSKDKNGKERRDSSKSDKDRNRHKDKDSRSRDKSKSSSSHKHSHADKYKKDKDKKKDKKDDHYSCKDKKTDRRSTDRDSNDGQSSKPAPETQTSTQNQKSQEAATSTNSTGNSEHNESTTKAPVIITTDVQDSEVTISPPESQIKVFKPKCASNMQEALRLRKIRKQLAKLEKKNQLSFTSVNLDSPILQSASINFDDLNQNRIDDLKREKIEVVPSPLQNTVISQDNWDAMEAKLRAEEFDDENAENCKFFQNVDVDKIEFLLFINEFIRVIEKQKEKKTTTKRKIDHDLRNNNKHLIPDKKVKVLKRNKGNNDKFSLPLSPAESEKSLGKKEEPVVPLKAKRNSIMSNQRYSSDDLYKPRPTFASSRRRGAKNLEN